MENNPIEIHSVTRRNILLGIHDKGITKNAVAVRAGIPSTTFTRKLDHPEQFTLKDLGSIAQVLEIELTELVRKVA